MSPDQLDYELDHTFSRASVFFRESNGKIQVKMCKLQLMMETQEGTQMLGSADINLAPYFEQTGVVKTIPLIDLNLIESAAITVSFSASSN